MVCPRTCARMQHKWGIGEEEKVGWGGKGRHPQDTSMHTQTQTHNHNARDATQNSTRHDTHAHTQRT